MKNWFIKRNTLFLFTTSWWFVFVYLSVQHYHKFQLLNLVGFIFLTFVPGWLTILSLRLSKISYFAIIALSVAFSILELMVVALIGNFILPKFGVSTPLAANILLVEISIIFFSVMILAWFRLKSWKQNILETFRNLFPSNADIFFAFFPVVLVVQSIVGAMSLNNGGTGWITFAMVGEIALFSFIFYLFFTKSVGENTIPISLFFIGLALLFMSSLRGWYITGHDIQTEYKVFELTKNAGLWNMDFYRDAYNACLSITILPTIYYKLMYVSDPFIYKFYFQIFFALCPGIAYLISKHWGSKRIAFLSSFYLMAFPSFFNDMPFLVRQELAFIFYGLMLYVIFEKNINLTLRRILFVVMGAGVIISHYSTTYSTLVIFLFAVISCRLFLNIIRYFKKRFNFFRASILAQHAEVEHKHLITIWMVVAMFALTFVWTYTITNTNGHLQDVLVKTLFAAKDGFTENNRSTDAANLLSFRKPSQQDEFETYINKVINPIRKKALPGVYYDEKIYNSYPYTALPDEQMPLTSVGKLTRDLGFDFATWSIIFGRLVAKFMQVLVPLGVLYFFVSRSSLKFIDVEFFLLAMYALSFMVLIVVVPVLSTEYGIFRAMQQSMFLLAVPMVLGSCWIQDWIRSASNFIICLFARKKPAKVLEKNSDLRGLFPIMLVLIFFLYSTSFIPQIFGNNSAMIYFSNTGRYYDNYLITAPEVSAVEWLGKISDTGDVSGLKIQIQTDRFSQRKLASLTSVDAYNEIFPGVVRKDSFVYIGKATALKNRATLVYGGDQITYIYPIQFLNKYKGLLYNNGSSRIYR